MKIQRACVKNNAAKLISEKKNLREKSVKACNNISVRIETKLKLDFTKGGRDECYATVRFW